MTAESTTEMLWQPSQTRQQKSQIQAFINFLNQQPDILKQQQNNTFDDYDSLHQWSVQHRETFWQQFADFCQIKFQKAASNILANDNQMPGAEWFCGSQLNFAEHLLSRRDDHPALIFYSEKGKQTELSYQALYQQVANTAAAMEKIGIQPGDRIAAILPNCPETIIAMLACTSLGAIWSSCSPDFGTQGVIDRFGQIEPKLLFACDGYYYNGKTIDCNDKVAEIAKQLPSLLQTIVVNFTAEPTALELANSISFNKFMTKNVGELAFPALPFNHPLYILYSSGTTGVPKCIVHGAGGTLLQHLKELRLHTDITNKDRVFYYTTCGWMMWNWLVSSLAIGATLILYDGSPFYPAPSALFDLAEKEHITVFGTSAKYLTALEKAGVKPAQEHQLDALKTLLSTGSPLAHESFDYVYRDIKNDICLSSISGGTDIVSCFALGCPIKPVYRGELQCIGLGMDVHFVDSRGQDLKGEKGELICRHNFPSMPIGFWNDPDGKRYQQAYFSKFPGIWAHGDYGEFTLNGGVMIHGRADATLNPGGVRIGTAEIYRQVERIDEVMESIAVGQNWHNDVRIILFVKLKPGLTLDSDLSQKICQEVKLNTTVRHVPARILQVEDIPKTRSGKLVELAVRNIIHNEPVSNTDALANPEALDYFRNRPELFS